MDRFAAGAGSGRHAAILIFPRGKGAGQFFCFGAQIFKRKIRNMQSPTASDQPEARASSRLSADSPVQLIPTSRLIQIAEQQRIRGHLTKSFELGMREMKAELERRRADLSFDPADMVDGE